jgi:retron-type reverse transcriptase
VRRLKKEFHQRPRGVPQGGIVSPILSNLLLNELDKFVDNLIKSFEAENLKKPYLPNPKYHAISMKIYRLKKKLKTIVQQ